MRRKLLIFLFFCCLGINLGIEAEQSTFVTLGPMEPEKDLHDYCADFLECESEMMNIHQTCTEKSRSATATACGLEEEFKKLEEFMEIRVKEFASCVSNETDLIEGDPDEVAALELPFGSCKPLDPNRMNRVMETDGCWKAVAVVKQECRKLQKCCPAAKVCTKSGRNSDATKDVRAKHIEINRKTLQCREEMKKVMEGVQNGTITDRKLIAKAHAVLTAERDTAMDLIQKKYVFTKKERLEFKLKEKQQELIAMNHRRPLFTTTPSTTMRFQNLLPKESEIIQKLVYKNNRRVTVRPIGRFSMMTTLGLTTPMHKAVTKPSNIRMSPRLETTTPAMTDEERPAMTDEERREKLIRQLQGSKMKQAPESTTIAPMESTTMTAMQSFEILKEITKQASLDTTTAPETTTFVPKFAWTTPKPAKKSRPILDSTVTLPSTTTSPSQGRVPKLFGMHQPQSFALPPNVNLARMKVFAARPSLRRIQWRPPSGYRTNPLGRVVVPYSFGRDGMAAKARAHSIRTQTDSEKPSALQVFQKQLRTVNGESEAFVNEKGVWTREPPRNPKDFDYPDYDGNFPSKTAFTGFLTSTTPAPRRSTRRIGAPSRKKIHDSEKTSAPLFVFNRTEIQEFFEENPSNSLSDKIQLVRTTMPNPEFPRSSTVQTPVQRSPPIIRFNESEMTIVKKELIKNLNMYFSKHEKDEKKKMSDLVEKRRLEQLRKTKMEYFQESEPMSYCHLYLVCMDQLNHVHKVCESATGRLIPGLPKRRFGECNRKLVPEYKKLDRLRKKLDHAFDDCLATRIINKEFHPVDSCPADWPTLPHFEIESTCTQRIRIIQNHCSKLSRCCSAAQDCRNKIDRNPLSENLIQKQEELAEASAKCQIKANKLYKKEITRHAGNVIQRRRSPKRVRPTKAPVSLPTTTVSTPKIIFPTLLPVASAPFSPQMTVFDRQIPSSPLRRIDTSNFRMFWKK